MSQRKPKNDRPRPPAAGLTQMTGGPGPTIVCDGRTWKLGYNTQNAKGRLEELIRNHVLEQSRNTDLPDHPEEYQDTRDRVKGGHYRTFSRGWLTILNSPDGELLYVLSLLQHNHPEATAKDVRRMLAAEPDQVVDALEEVSPDFWRVVAVQWAGDEKQTDPAKAAALGEQLAEKIVEGFAGLRTRTTPEPAIG